MPRGCGWRPSCGSPTTARLRPSFKTAWTGMFGHVWTSACT
ncbi:unnamed protein product [Chondrus crispus]|uniref:Uncharacterized protein n=1 Tax=Chondrus crispus TaxID=2769 RepID=R7Q847_CHOCR|nr:unnamed protein product [Chondrus crispus]CDF33655.1 unnamed protein product [Chondrus crispus]|eukprot:XP_005713474.1 unnamed protein product [Chondrus crispus]